MCMATLQTCKTHHCLLHGPLASGQQLQNPNGNCHQKALEQQLLHRLDPDMQ